jgi:hypothetical protein
VSKRLIGSLKYDRLRHADYVIIATYASVLTIMVRILLSRMTPEAPIFIVSCERMGVTAAYPEHRTTGSLVYLISMYFIREGTENSHVTNIEPAIFCTEGLSSKSIAFMLVNEN